MTLNYDFKLDLDVVNNSNTQLIRRIPRGSRVLELGCATGYMSEYLRDELDCTVVGVEYDAEAAAEERIDTALLELSSPFLEVREEAARFLSGAGPEGVGKLRRAYRAADYLRSASPDDRRYLLFNPLVKMKVTMEGEKVIDELWDVIAAKGFEAEPFFEIAAVEIRSLPKLEGTAHVNMALIVKFMKNYLFAPAEYLEIAERNDLADDNIRLGQYLSLPEGRP